MRYVLALAVLCAGVAVGQELPEDTNEIKTLTVEQAKVLKQRASGLALDGLTTVSPDVAHVLAHVQCDLFLNGLTTLTDEAAQALGQHEGWLRLDGLTTLSDEAAAALRSNPEIHLPAKFKQ